MKYFEFEKNISRQLENETIAFDVNGLLDDLDKKKKKRKLIIWFWPIGILSMLYLSAIYFNGSKLPYSKIELTHSIVDQNDISNSFDLANVTLAEKKATDKLSVAQVTAAENSTEKIKTETGLTKVNITNSKSIFSNVKQKSIGKSPVIKLGANTNNIFLLQEEISISNIESNYDQKLETIFSNVENTQQSLLILEPVTTLGEIANIKMLTLDDNIENRLLGRKNVDCPSFSNPDKNSGIEVVAEFGVFKPIKTLSDVSGEANILTALRQQNEKPLVGFQAGLYLKYNLSRSPFYIFGGTNYSRFTEKMALDYVVTEIDTTIELVSITESELGDTITYIYGEVFNETTTTGSKLRHYSISSFDIPLHVGYEFELDKFSIGVELGLALNISLVAHGKFLSSESEFLDLEEENPFKDRVGLRYDSKLFAAYNLSSRQKIYASVGLNVTPQSFSKPEGQTTQMYKTVGFNIGYGFSF